MSVCTKGGSVILAPATKLGAGKAVLAPATKLGGGTEAGSSAINKCCDDGGPCSCLATNSGGAGYAAYFDSYQGCDSHSVLLPAGGAYYNICTTASVTLSNSLTCWMAGNVTTDCSKFGWTSVNNGSCSPTPTICQSIVDGYTTWWLDPSATSCYDCTDSACSCLATNSGGAGYAAYFDSYQGCDSHSVLLSAGVQYYDNCTSSSVTLSNSMTCWMAGNVTTDCSKFGWNSVNSGSCSPTPTICQSIVDGYTTWWLDPSATTCWDCSQADCTCFAKAKWGSAYHSNYTGGCGEFSVLLTAGGSYYNVCADASGSPSTSLTCYEYININNDCQLFGYTSVSSPGCTPVTTCATAPYQGNSTLYLDPSAVCYDCSNAGTCSCLTDSSNNALKYQYDGCGSTSIGFKQGQTVNDVCLNSSVILSNSPTCWTQATGTGATCADFGYSNSNTASCTSVAISACQSVVNSGGNTVVADTDFTCWDCSDESACSCLGYYDTYQGCGSTTISSQWTNNPNASCAKPTPAITCYTMAGNATTDCSLFGYSSSSTAPVCSPIPASCQSVLSNGMTYYLDGVTCYDCYNPIPFAPIGPAGEMVYTGPE